MINDRLKLIAKHYGVSGREIGRRAGLKDGGSEYNGLGDGMSVKKLRDILLACPEISFEWLIFGEGNMLKPKTIDGIKVNEITPEVFINRFQELVGEKKELELKLKNALFENETLKSLSKNKLVYGLSAVDTNVDAEPQFELEETYQ